MSYDELDREKQLKHLKSLENPATMAELQEAIAKLEADNERLHSIVHGQELEIMDLVTTRDSYTDLVKNQNPVCWGCINAMYTSNSSDGDSSFTACLLSAEVDSHVFQCNQFSPIKSSI